ncbi:hypothetical protein [Methylobacterium sp. Leaf465]|uniref:hypothetical protein n=1 Tax=Methylobacterium sp. Leaf465 TaxID=1736385 RepID=UPI000A52DAFB|nr:hypothetical protein [Methylobacterium sp. Leaf465]
MMRANRKGAAGDGSPAAQLVDAPAAHVRRGDAGRGASSERARRYVLDLMPILESIGGEVGRTPQCLAPELTRRGVRKPRGGAVWTPVDVGRLLHRIGTERVR